MDYRYRKYYLAEIRIQNGFDRLCQYVLCNCLGCRFFKPYNHFVKNESYDGSIIDNYAVNTMISVPIRSDKVFNDLLKNYDFNIKVICSIDKDRCGQ